MLLSSGEANELEQKELTLEAKEGCLVMTRPDLLTRDTMKKIEKMLNEAEENVAKEKARIEQERDDWFEEFARKVGRPLLSPKWGA